MSYLALVMRSGKHSRLELLQAIALGRGKCNSLEHRLPRLVSRNQALTYSFVRLLLSTVHNREHAQPTTGA